MVGKSPGDTHIFEQFRQITFSKWHGSLVILDYNNREKVSSKSQQETRSNPDILMNCTNLSN
jgi:hypothetical protein